MVWMILVTIWLSTTLGVNSESSISSKALDVLLQDYAYQAFNRPKTGLPYDGVVPSNLAGIRVTALRLKSGSLWARGVEKYQEFEIPKGVLTHPYVERLALVYHNLANRSLTYFPLQGYTYLAPILGLICYNATDLEAKDLPYLDIRLSTDPISIHFSELLARPYAYEPIPKCVFFHINGSVRLTDMLSGHICATFEQGHFSVVVESMRGEGSKKRNLKKVIGDVFGGLGLMVVLGMVVGWTSRYRRSRKMHGMEKAAEVGEVLYMAAVGTTKAPAAIGTRTHPKLETDYWP